DADFVAENVTGFERLRRTVAHFTPEYVADRAGIDAKDLVSAARIFGTARRGYVAAGTGPNMTGEGTLLEYLVLCLDTVCGNWSRAGDPVRNAMSLTPSQLQMSKAQALGPFPTFGYGEKARVRGLTFGVTGMPTGALSDEMLLPGEGQVK